MRSIFTKILLWFLATMALSFVAFIGVSFYASRTPNPKAMFGRVLVSQCEEARFAFESGGRPALQNYLKRLGTYFPGEHYLVNSQGVDMATGEDRRALMERSLHHSKMPFHSGPVIFSDTTSDKQYRMIVWTQPVFDYWGALPYYFWILFTITVLCYVLAVHLANPLRSLRETVERFGQGDLGARTGLARRDEFGDVARAFDKMADRIETLLTAERRLLQDVSHELRSPLSRLGFAIELAKSSGDQEKALGRIQRESLRLNSLVDQLLQVTRAEGDPASRNLEDLSLRHLLRSLVEDCALEAETRGIRLSLRADQPVVLRADRELLRRAIENVLRNAIRHSPEGSSIEIALDHGADVANLSVRDFGEGVPDENLEQIFKPFFRVDAARNSDSGGLGLGLAIAQRAIRLHHGQLSAQNMSPGLCVRMELPVNAAV